MHIPDGMLDPKTFGTLWAGAAGAIGYASVWVRRHFDSSRIVLMAVLASLIFAFQMLNFPIAGGTSGHFVGASLAGILLGSWPAAIVMSAVLIIQCLFFGDGGVTALGANIINMGVIGAFLAPLIYRLVCRIHPGYLTKLLGAGIGAFCSVVVTSAVVALELWISGSAQFFAVLGAMTFWHVFIGIGEGIITAGIVAYVARVRPAILEGGEDSNRRSTASVAVVFGVLALAGSVFSFLASTHPDGLEYVYETMGIGTAPLPESPLLSSPMQDYLLPGVANDQLAGIGAAIIGTVIVGLAVWALALGLVRRRTKQKSISESAS
ncbi:MAG: PDGLE domain-containing protein [Actinomycetia bacterium]|nr:PDGLE domain-containing protein [Actinomycetes bacterium]